MKKVLSLVAVVAMMLFVGKADAQLTFRLGYAPQTYTVDYNGSKKSAEMNGLFVGLSKNIGLSGDLKVSVGVDARFNFKSETSTIGVTSLDVTRTQFLLDVPVLFNYGLRLNSDITFSAFVGPTFSYAFFGQNKWEGNASLWGAGISSDGTEDWYDNTGRGRFDVSVTFGLKLAINEYSLYGGYNMGLVNLTDANNTTLKGSNIFVGVGLAL